MLIIYDYNVLDLMVMLSRSSDYEYYDDDEEELLLQLVTKLLYDVSSWTKMMIMRSYMTMIYYDDKLLMIL